LIQRNRGLINVAFFSKFKLEFSKALAGLIGKIEGDQGTVVLEVLDKFKGLAKTIASL